MRKLALLSLIAVSCAAFSSNWVSSLKGSQAKAEAAASSSWSYPSDYGTQKRIIVYAGSNTASWSSVTANLKDNDNTSLGTVSVQTFDSSHGVYYFSFAASLAVSTIQTNLSTGGGYLIGKLLANNSFAITAEMKSAICTVSANRRSTPTLTSGFTWDYPTANLPYVAAALLEGCYTCHEGSGTCNGYSSIAEITSNYISKMTDEELATFKSLTINDIGYSSDNPNPSGGTTINAWEKVKVMSELANSNSTTAISAISNSKSYMFAIAISSAAIIASATVTIITIKSRKKKTEKK